MLKPLRHGRHPAADVMLAVSLAGCAGATNAIALRTAGVFAASMTGNVSWIAERLETGEWGAAGFFVAVLVLFVAGSFCCASVAAHGERRRWTGVPAACLLAESLAICGCAFVARAPLLCGALAFLMGWQNSLATTLTGARVRSTHLSGICTDLGIELSGLCSSAERADPGAAARRHRVLLGSATIAAFCAGAFLGCVAQRRFAELAVLGVGAALGAIAVSGHRSAARVRAGAA